jgi:hypothetical protein
MGSEMGLTSGDALEPEWNALVEAFAAMITLSSEYVVLQVYTRHDNQCGPYVQTLQEEDGALHLEAASNQFLDPPIGPDAVNSLRAMGWIDPDPEDGIPNHHIFLEPDDVSPGTVARFLVRTLRDCFLVTPRDSFEFAPPELFLQIVTGEFGQPLPMTFTAFDLHEWRRKDSE